MILNTRFNLLKEIFWGNEKKDGGKVNEMADEDKKKEKKLKKIYREQDLSITETLRSEFHLLKFPFFDLSPRASKKDRIEIREIEETEEGKIEILWKVSRNIDANFPASFARKIHKEIVEKILNGAKRPVPRLIKLGSVRQICRDLNIAISGKSLKEIKKALQDIKGATIEAKGTFRQKEKNGTKKFFEGSFNLYDMVFFTGETLPDGTEADAVYVLLNDMYIQNFNNNFVVPLDYQYFQSLKGDIASRMYEVLNIWFYPALENGRAYIQKEYSELCAYFPLTRQDTKKKAKGQLKKAHQQHIDSGFLASEPEWMDTPQKKDDWMIRYWIGKRAKGWNQQNKRSVALEEIKQIEVKLKNKIEKANESKEKDEVELNLLITQLMDLGVTRKVAEDLASSKNSQVIDEWTKAIYEVKAKDRAAFVVKAIEENWELPEVFRKKKEEEEKQEALLKKQEKQAELSKKYEEYKRGKMDSYLTKITPDQKQEELERIKQELYKRYPFSRTWGEDTQVLKSTLESTFLEEVKKEVHLLSFQEWLEGQKIAL